MPRTAKPKPVITPEREVQAQVIDAAKYLGVELRRNNTGMATNPSGQKVRFGQVGNADLTGTIPYGPHRGKRLEIEVKRKGKTPTDAQWNRIHATNAEGGFAFYVDDSKDAMRVLGRLLEGWWVEIDANNKQTVTDGKGDR